MMMKIFYSWQSDSPNNTNRGFIKNALDKAARELSIELLEEAERVEVTQDTQDVPGSPEIVATILRKIREADVFVGDVTLVGATDTGKKLMSSNVAIELGYAMAKDADGVGLVNVMNEAYGAFAELPFDLRNRRKPICYTLLAGASVGVS
jgi:nucleoside 2-deoxyribosyltransferase